MKFRFLSVLFILSLMSCVPQLGSNGMFDANLATETHSHPEFNIESYNTLISPQGFRHIFEKIDFFDEVLVSKDFSDSVFVEMNNSSRYENIKLDLERQGINGPVLLAQHYYTSGLLASQNMEFLDLETGDVILDVRIPNPSFAHPTVFSESGTTYGNALIEYISNNSDWDPNKNQNIVQYPYLDFGVTGGNSNFWINKGYFSETGFYLGVMSELRLSAHLAIQPELIYSKIDQTHTYYFPLKTKLYLGEKFNLHAGPQLNYIHDPDGYFNRYRDTGDDYTGKFHSLGFDIVFGVGYDFGNHFFIDASFGHELTTRRTVWNDFGIRIHSLKFGVGYKF